MTKWGKLWIVGFTILIIIAAVLTYNESEDITLNISSKLSSPVILPNPQLESDNVIRNFANISLEELYLKNQSEVHSFYGKAEFILAGGPTHKTDFAFQDSNDYVIYLNPLREHHLQSGKYYKIKGVVVKAMRGSCIIGYTPDAACYTFYVQEVKE